jgi:penicillin G amidase
MAGKGKRILRWTGGLFVVFLLSAIAGGYLYIRSTLPNLDGVVRTDGIHAEVQIVRDSFGMPHIFADNDEDAAFGIGYATAQDRLFQMEMIRRAISGRLSEIFGDSLLKVDRLFRTITAQRSVDSLYKLLSPDIKTLLESYADGVNRYISDPKTTLPPEFAMLGIPMEPWRPADGLAAQYFMAWGLNFSFSNEIMRAAITAKVGKSMADDIYIDYPAGGPVVVPDSISPQISMELFDAAAHARDLYGFPFRGASNNWAVSGKRSVTGKPLLANDMHLGLMLPAVWYEAHIVTPTQNVSGVALAGMPCIVAGANQHIAWSFTNAMADDADFYLEKINPADSTEYEYQGRMEKMVIRHDTIRTRSGKSIPLDIRITRHGPIIDGLVPYDSLTTRPLSMRWSNFDFSDEAHALSLVNHAKNIDDIEAAARLFKCPAQNWIYADDQGNIGYWLAAGIPRRHGFDGSSVLPGWDGNHEWDGYIPFDSLPHMKNPESGFLATANNKQAGNNFPYPISHTYGPPERISRIITLLQEKERLGLDDFARIQSDVSMEMARVWVPKMLAGIHADSLSPGQKQALDLFGKWNYSGAPDQPGASIFSATVQCLVEGIFKDHLGDTLYKYYVAENMFTILKAVGHLLDEKDSPWFDNPITPQRETGDMVLSAAFSIAVDSLSTKLGDNPNDWQWGKLHTLTLYHPIGRHIPILGRLMNSATIPVGGGESSVNAEMYRLSDPYTVVAGASQRHIFELGNIDNSLRIIPGGVSGNFVSPNYTDQVELWRQGKYRPFVLSREKVMQDAAHTLKLEPTTDSSAPTSSK